MKANLSLIGSVTRAMVALLALQQLQAAEQIQGQRLTNIKECVKTTAQIMRDGQTNFLQESPNIPVMNNKNSAVELCKKMRIERKNHPDSPYVSAWEGPIKPTSRSGSPFFPPGVNNNTTSKLGINFTGATFSDSPAPNIYVHDIMGAIGPQQYIITNNGGVRSFCIDRTKGTAEPDGILDTVLSSFLNISAETSGAENAIISDPIIRFDAFSQRWYIVCLAFTLRAFSDDFTPPNNFLCLAVSDGPVITRCTKWRILQIPHNQIPGPDGQGGDDGGFFDFPSMGIDQRAVYIGINVFGLPPFGVDMAAIVVQKEALLDFSKPLVITAFRNLLNVNNLTGPFAPAGIDNFDPNPEFGYFIGTNFFSFGVIDLVRIINPGSTNPTISPTISIIVPSTSFGNPVSYKGNFAGFFANLDVADDRIHQGHVRHNKLFTNNTFSIGVDRFGVANDSPADDRQAFRWYEFNLKGNDPVELPTSVPTINQVGTIWDPTDTPNPLNFIFGSVMTNENEDLTACSTETSALVTPNSVAFTRKASDQLCTIGPKQMLTNSTALYNNGVFSGQFVRWGDYSNNSPDPKNPCALWTIQEYVSGYGNFAHHVTQLLPNK